MPEEAHAATRLPFISAYGAEVAEIMAVTLPLLVKR